VAQTSATGVALRSRIVLATAEGEVASTPLR
jgi:hypothetical protein